MISMKLIENRLGNLLDNYDFLRKPLSSLERENFKGKYPYYGAQGIIDFVKEYKFDGEFLLIAEDGENLSSRNQPIAQIASGKFWVNNHAHAVKTNNLADLRFVCYALNNLDIKGYVTGSAQPKLSQTNLNKIKVLFPKMEYQRTISKVLNNYDQLIENNNKRIKLLESMAEELYKEWFVRFRFPGYENTEFENGVPKGWKYNNLFEQANIIYGYAFKSELFTDDETLNPVVRIRDIPTNQTKTFTQEDCDEKYLIKADEILVGMDGIFHMCLWNGEKAYLNQRVVKLSSKDSDMCNLFLSLSIKEQIKFWESTICGTTVAHLGDKHLKRIYVLMPDKKIMKMENAIFKNIMSESRMLIQENRRLIKQRDLLLPRLMSGKLSVEGKEVI